MPQVRPALRAGQPAGPHALPAPCPATGDRPDAAGGPDADAGSGQSARPARRATGDRPDAAGGPDAEAGSGQSARPGRAAPGRPVVADLPDASGAAPPGRSAASGQTAPPGRPTAGEPTTLSGQADLIGPDAPTGRSGSAGAGRSKAAVRPSRPGRSSIGPVLSVRSLASNAAVAPPVASPWPIGPLPARSSRSNPPEGSPPAGAAPRPCAPAAARKPRAAGEAAQSSQARPPPRRIGVRHGSALRSAIAKAASPARCRQSGRCRGTHGPGPRP